jgi:hypothetical protein
MEPINYLTQVSDPFSQAVQGVQLGAGMAELQQKQALIVQQQQQQQLAAQEQARFFAKPNPTMRDALQFASVLPKDRADALRPYIENFSKEKQQNVLKSNGQILSALQVNPETGIKLLKDYATAQRNSGDEEEAALYDRIAEAAVDPTRGPAMAFKSLVTVTSGIPGAKEMFESIDKAAGTARAEALAPSALIEAVAKADKAVADASTAQATATNAPEKAAADAALAAAQAESARIKALYAERTEIAGLNKTNWDIKDLKSKIEDRSAKLNLDRQITQATVAEKFSSIQARLADIPEGARKLINESSTLAATSKQAATQYNDLANRILTAEGGKGSFTTASEWFAKSLGQQDAWTQIRNEYTRVRNSVAIKSLPPGVATDKDIELALKGIPPENANSATLASFLRGSAKLQDIDSSINNAKTDWLSQNNGLLTRAKGTFIAGDYATKPGETFNDFAQRIVGDVSKRYAPQPSPVDQIRAIDQTAGRTPQAPAPVDVRSRADAILKGG